MIIFKVGTFTVLPLVRDNPILQDSSAHKFPTEGKIFSQGQGRRCQIESILHADSFLKNYEDLLKAYFDKGHRNSSVKRNAAKMHGRLNQQFLNKFSIPSKTKIKEYNCKITHIYTKTNTDAASADITHGALP